MNRQIEMSFADFMKLGLPMPFVLKSLPRDEWKFLKVLISPSGTVSIRDSRFYEV